MYLYSFQCGTLFLINWGSTCQNHLNTGFFCLTLELKWLDRLNISFKMVEVYVLDPSYSYFLFWGVMKWTCYSYRWWLQVITQLCIMSLNSSSISYGKSNRRIAYLHKLFLMSCLWVVYHCWPMIHHRCVCESIVWGCLLPHAERSS
jgi:hypothetical protein